MSHPNWLRSARAFYCFSTSALFRHGGRKPPLLAEVGQFCQAGLVGEDLDFAC